MKKKDRYELADKLTKVICEVDKADFAHPFVTPAESEAARIGLYMGLCLATDFVMGTRPDVEDYVSDTVECVRRGCHE